jgi:hypothetical protein
MEAATVNGRRLDLAFIVSLPFAMDTPGVWQFAALQTHTNVRTLHALLISAPQLRSGCRTDITLCIGFISSPLPV